MIKKIETKLPTTKIKNESLEDFLWSDQYFKWEEKREKLIKASCTEQSGMDLYYQSVADTFSKNGRNENLVYSPLNIYMALSLLAELSAGETRDQILTALYVNDIKSLRKRVKALWDANYQNMPFAKSLLGNSIWLRNDISYHNKPLKTLADDYHASSFIGDMGSEELNHALQEWTDKNTGGLLTKYANNMELDADTVLALVSTLYLKATWGDPFEEEDTTSETFHGLNGDTEVQMMHSVEDFGVLVGKHFKAVGKYLEHSGKVYFFLPEEDINAADILCDPEALSIIRDPNVQSYRDVMVNLSVPRFRTTTKCNLLDAMNALGITDVTDPDRADFSPLTSASKNVWLNSAEHTATAEINEEGVTGAAYTEDVVCGAIPPEEEIDFVLDRPFCFAVVASDRSILFSGVVQTID